MKCKWTSLLVTLLLLALSINSSVSSSILHLNGQDWTLTGPYNISVKAFVPGSVHTDLLRNGIISDPLYRMNDDVLRWIGNSNWNYTKTFQVDADFLKHRRVDLVCGGLDTISTIVINDVVVANTSNMFRRYVISVRNVLKEGSNMIQVVFKSPVIYATEQAAAYSYPVPPKCPPPVQNGECSFNFIRKEACSFSWDWGPSFPTIGIWKNITLEAYDAAIIRYVTTETKFAEKQWNLIVTIFFDTISMQKNINGIINLNVPELGVSHQELVKLSSNSTRHEIIIKLNGSVKVWWPNGLGQQNLYELSVGFIDSLGDVEQRMLQVGFRTVELVQDVVPGHKPGYTFYFKINGVPVFMKGSNWIPADSFQERITESYIERILLSAVEANMNMLRVWGGGVYESEEFYSLADRLGIMIWQDFMFACALYPTNDDFISNVREEVLHQVRRLKRHPSIVIWSGNNENEGALANNWFNISKSEYKRYYDDYLHLYVDTIYAIISQEDTSRPFVPSSPSNGIDTVAEGWVAKDPQSTRFGDIHYYNYTMDSWNSSRYLVPRFASEFGLQSWCSMETLEPVSVPADWDIESDFVMHRQHHDKGEDEMMMELSMHLIPPSAKNRTKRFIDFIYLTQINQAVGIKTEVELYRRHQSSLVMGEGLTMGALYWQLNDIWQAPTWSSIEYGGKWKMLHYASKKFFSRTMISPFVDNGNLHVYFVNDNLYSDGYQIDRSHSSSNDVHHFHVVDEIDKHFYVGNNRKEVSFNMVPPIPPIPDDVQIILNINCFFWSSLNVSKTWATVFTKPKLPAEKILTSNVETMLHECHCDDTSKCFFTFTGTYANQTVAFPDNFFLLRNLTDVSRLRQANIGISDLSFISPTRVEMVLMTDQIALFVWLEAKGYPGYFSDNGFLMTTKTTVVTFISWETIDDLTKFSSSLSVKSLVDVYEMSESNDS